MKADHPLCSSARAHLGSNIVLADGSTPIEVARQVEGWALRKGIHGPIKLAVRQQPEFFANWKLMGQLAFMGEVADNLNERGIATRTVFISTDYDAWTDRRFRRAELPAVVSIGSNSHLNVTPAERIARATLITFIGPIPATYSRYFADQVSGTMHALLGGLDRRQRRIFQNVLEKFIEDQSERLQKASDWPAFCTDHIASVAASLRAKPLEVMSGYEILARRQHQLRELVSRDKPRWLHGCALWSLCSSCGARFPFVQQDASCPHCRSRWHDDDDLILPKVVLDDLLEETLDHGEVLFSHIGALAHLISAHRAGFRAGIRPARLHIVSDRGCRRDYLADHVMRFSIAGAKSGHQNEREIASLLRKAGRGEYSTIYYLLGEQFNEELTR